MRWDGHVACMGERCIQGFGGKPEGKNHLGDPGIDGWIILRSSGSGMWGALA